MKKIVGLVACLAVAACACDENQWEEVDNVVVDDVVFEEPAEPVYVPVAQPVNDAAYVEVASAPQVVSQPCCNAMYVQPCMQPCGCQPVAAPQPKVTKTRKIITTTTTYEEPCTNGVCEPVVTTHEEIVPVEDEENQAQVVVPETVQVPVTEEVKAEKKVEAKKEGDYINVKVEKTPYSAEVIGMNTAQVGAAVAVEYSPEVYNVVATRATNRMLQDTSAIYDNGKTKTVYIKDTKLLSSDLPYGSHRLRGATRDLISGSRTFDIVNDPHRADFIIETSADWYVGSDNTAPALQYKLSLSDKNGKKVNDWVEVIRQVKE